MTARDIIDGAYEIIGVLDVDTDLVATALTSLNDMVLSWKLQTLIPFHNGFSTLTSTLSRREYAETIKYNLAIRLAQKEGEPVSSRIQDIAKSGLKDLKNDSASKSINEESKLDSYLVRPLRR